MRLVLPYRKNSWMRKCICVAAQWISAIHFLNGSGFSTHGEPRNPCAKKRGKLLGVALTLLLHPMPFWFCVLVPSACND